MWTMPSSFLATQRRMTSSALEKWGCWRTQAASKTLVSKKTLTKPSQSCRPGVALGASAADRIFYLGDRCGRPGSIPNKASSRFPEAGQSRVAGAQADFIYADLRVQDVAGLQMQPRPDLLGKDHPADFVDGERDAYGKSIAMWQITCQPSTRRRGPEGARAYVFSSEGGAAIPTGMSW